MELSEARLRSSLDVTRCVARDFSVTDSEIRKRHITIHVHHKVGIQSIQQAKDGQIDVCNCSVPKQRAHLMRIQHRQMNICGMRAPHSIRHSVYPYHFAATSAIFTTSQSTNQHAHGSSMTSILTQIKSQFHHPIIIFENPEKHWGCTTGQAVKGTAAVVSTCPPCRQRCLQSRP